VSFSLAGFNTVAWRTWSALVGALLFGAILSVLAVLADVVFAVVAALLCNVAWAGAVVVPLDGAPASALITVAEYVVRELIVVAAATAFEGGGSTSISSIVSSWSELDSACDCSDCS
jgi:hypothetical protein